MPYLTGFDSSQYDYDKEQIFKTAANDLTKEAIKCIKGTIPSYKTLELPVQNVKFTSTEILIHCCLSGHFPLSIRARNISL